jgi:hypothetical protein
MRLWYMSRLVAEAKAKAGDFNSQDIANTLNALAKFDHYDAAVVSRLAAEAKVKAGDFNSQNIANTLNAFASLDHYDASVVGRLVAEAKAKAGDFNSQNIANTLWALVVFGYYSQDVFLSLCSSMACVAHDSWQPENLMQIYQVTLAVSVEQPSWQLVVPCALKKASATALSAERSSIKSSNLHLQVSKALSRLQVRHTNEAMVGGCSVDIQIDELVSIAKTSAGQRKVVVEVDGPSHFCQAAGGKIDRAVGSTLLKRRLLEGQGWSCVSIPYFEWDALNDHCKQQEEYLRRKLHNGSDTCVRGSPSLP